MSDDLATQLREQASSDHVRGCQGRQYSCDCGYDTRGEGLLEQAATALTEARAEIERLKAGWHDCITDLVAEKKRALAAESELSTLRARVREVVGPFAKAGELFGPRLSDEHDQCIYSPAAGDEYSLCGDHLRAARQLMEEVK